MMQVLRSSAMMYARMKKVSRLGKVTYIYRAGSSSVENQQSTDAESISTLPHTWGSTTTEMWRCSSHLTSSRTACCAPGLATTKTEEGELSQCSLSVAPA